MALKEVNIYSIYDRGTKFWHPSQY